MTNDQIASDLKWGTGPTILIDQLDNYCSKCNKDTYGVYREQTPNSLLIDIDLVNELEQSKTGSIHGDAWSFLMGVTILHEYVHLGDALDGKIYPNEAGNAFEKDAYGQTVWRKNATTILYRN